MLLGMIQPQEQPWLSRSPSPRQALPASRACHYGGIPVAPTLTLNERALRLADYAASNAAALRIQTQTTTAGARLIDFGVKTPGGLQAGLALARICLAGQGE